MSKKIKVDPGHGGTDPGAVGNGLREKDLTLDISKRIKKYLDDNYTGHTVKLTRTNDKYLTLSQRAKLANDWKADLFVSIHINAGGGTGYESFIHSNLSNTSATAKMQNTVHNVAMKKMSVSDRGKKKANFAVLRETNMQAILPENLFIDRKEDADKLKKSSELQKIAEGHAIGIAKTLGLKKKSGKVSKPSTSKPKPTPSKQKKKNEFKWLGTDLKGRRVESIYRGSDGLNYYNGPRWTNPTGTFGYGEGWIVDNKYLVDGHPMYRVQNSRKQLFWITASPKYVRVR